MHSAMLHYYLYKQESKQASKPASDRFREYCITRIPFQFCQAAATVIPSDHTENSMVYRWPFIFIHAYFFFVRLVNGNPFRAHAQKRPIARCLLIEKEQRLKFEREKKTNTKQAAECRTVE